MPVEFTPEEKIKLDTYFKEIGFENANPTDFIKGLNNESKTNREAREALEKQFKTAQDDLKKTSETVASLQKERDDRDKAQKIKDDQVAADRKKIDDEKKTLDERLTDLKKEISGQFEDASKAQQAEQKALVQRISDANAKLEKRDNLILVRSVKEVARAQGIIDTDLVDHLDLKSVKVDDGEPDYEAIDKVIEEHKKLKPHLYGAAPARDQRDSRDTRSSTERPGPTRQTTSTQGPNWAALGDEDFERQEAAMRGQRA